MSDASSASVLRTILWPLLITITVSAARMALEVTGRANSLSGGRGFWLGITWLVFVFGAFFAWRLARSGHGPRVRRAWLWSLLPMLAIAGVVAFRFGDLDLADKSDAAFAALRTSVLPIAAMAVAGAVVAGAAWPRLGVTLLVYGLLARAVVTAQTWLAKSRNWDTHYTKFGPAGIERDMADTMISASFAQFFYWVPFTVIAGTLAGCVVAGRKRS